MTAIIGWISSIILLATLIAQIVRQYRSRTRKGVSRWLFIGQLATSIGFTIYSVSVGDTVFIVTNSLLALSAAVGIFIYYSHPSE